MSSASSSASAMLKAIGYALSTPFFVTLCAVAVSKEELRFDPIVVSAVYVVSQGLAMVPAFLWYFLRRSSMVLLCLVPIFALSASVAATDFIPGSIAIWFGFAVVLSVVSIPRRRNPPPRGSHGHARGGAIRSE